MIKVEEIISDLLLHHTCVIIPDFGGFVAKPISAKMDIDRGIILPPSKQLLFNKHLIANDGLLISEFSNKNSISFLASENHVSEYVFTIKQTLKNFKQYTLPKIGTFHLDEEGNINFEQDRYFNLLLNAYGLTQVQFIANPVSKVEEVKVVNEDVIPKAEPVKRNLWKYAAAACLLPIAFYTFWIPVKSDVLQSGLISYKDFNPFYKKESGLYSQKPLTIKSLTKKISKNFDEKLTATENSDLANYKLSNKKSVVVELQEETIPTPQSSESPKNTKQIKSTSAIQNSTKSFEYVVGCFANQSNADNLKLKLQNEGFQVRLNPAGGLIRVIVGGAGSMDSLQAIISKANSLGYQGWILKN